MSGLAVGLLPMSLKWNTECACACGTQTEGGTVWSAVAEDDVIACRGARDVRAKQNCGGGRWTGKPWDLVVSRRGNHGPAFGVVMVLSEVKRRCYPFLDCHRLSYSFCCQRSNYSS